MNTRRIFGVVVVSAALALGLNAFVPTVGACGSTMPGSCKTESAPQQDQGVIARFSDWVVSLFG